MFSIIARIRRDSQAEVKREKKDASQSLFVW